MPIPPPIQETTTLNPNNIVDENNAGSNDEDYYSDDEDTLNSLAWTQWFAYRHFITDDDFKVSPFLCRGGGSRARKENPLKISIKNGEFDAVKSAIEKNDFSNEKMSSLLTTAAYANNIEIFDLLIEHKADINENNEDRETPLSSALRYGQLDMIELLINKNADLSSIDEDGESLLDLAIRNKQYNIAEILKKAGVETNCIEEILIYAIRQSAKLEDIDNLLKFYENINDVASKRFTPLMALCDEFENEWWHEIQLSTPNELHATEIMEQLIEFNIKLIATPTEAPGQIITDF